MPSERERLRILLLSGEETEAELLREILARHVTLATAATLAEVVEHLRSGHFDAFLCDWSFAGGTWEDALDHVQRRCPDLPTVVISRVGGEREWVEVLTAGDFDLVAAPYCEHTVLSVLENAATCYPARAA
ncbi:MAG: hypothetical protein HY647_02785 [Acidobacteria bacterium]|nr:hypothetical protein [Acidobacteriota bacterium]